MPLSQQLYLVVSNIPLFVWPLFALLVFVGLRASKPRVMPIAVFYGLPFIGLAALPTLMRFGLSAHVLVTFLAAFAVGALQGFNLQKRLITSIENSRITVKGEWFTMIAVMTIFFSNFALGTINAVKPELAASQIFITAFLCLVGFCSGTFFGRSLQVIKRSRRIAV